jgi:hypothetical protein
MQHGFLLNFSAMKPGVGTCMAFAIGVYITTADSAQSAVSGKSMVFLLKFSVLKSGVVICLAFAEGEKKTADSTKCAASGFCAIGEIRYFSIITKRFVTEKLCSG